MRDLEPCCHILARSRELRIASGGSAQRAQDAGTNAWFHWGLGRKAYFARRICSSAGRIIARGQWLAAIGMALRWIQPSQRAFGLAHAKRANLGGWAMQHMDLQLRWHPIRA